LRRGGWGACRGELCCVAGALSAVWRLESSVAEPPRRGGLADVRGLSVAPTGGKASGAPPRVSAVRVGAVRWAPCGGLALWCSGRGDPDEAARGEVRPQGLQSQVRRLDVPDGRVDDEGGDGHLGFVGGGEGHEP